MAVRFRCDGRVVGDEELFRYQLRGSRGKVKEQFLVGHTPIPQIAKHGDLLMVRTGNTELRTVGDAGNAVPITTPRYGGAAALPADAVAIEVQDLAPLIADTGSIVAGGPLPPSQRLAPVGRRSLVPWLIAGAALSLLLAAVALRRRSGPMPDDDWMAHARDEGPAGPS